MRTDEKQKLANGPSALANHAPKQLKALTMGIAKKGPVVLPFFNEINAPDWLTPKNRPIDLKRQFRPVANGGKSQ